MAFRRLVAASDRDLSPAVRRSPAQPQGCEPREDGSAKWGPETCNDGSVRPEYKDSRASTDNAGHHNEKHRLCSDLISFNSYQRFVSVKQHIASLLTKRSQSYRAIVRMRPRFQTQKGTPERIARNAVLF